MDTRAQKIAEIMAAVEELNDKGLDFVFTVADFSAKNPLHRADSTEEERRAKEIEREKAVSLEEENLKAVDEMNKTSEAVKLISYAFPVNDGDGDGYKAFKELLFANQYERDIPWLCSKFYRLGEIFGKREERASRKEN